MFCFFHDNLLLTIFNYICVLEFLLLEDSYAMAEIELFGELTKPGHPLSNFSCGNLKTLWHKNQDKNGKKLTQELSKSHKKYYVGSGMTLAIEVSPFG